MKELMEFPYIVLIGSKEYPILSFKDASIRWETFISNNMNPYGSNYISSVLGTPLILDNDKRIIGHISYNGRVWQGKPEDWNDNTILLFDNRNQSKGN